MAPRHDRFDEIDVNGIPAIRLPNGRIVPIPRGGDGTEEDPAEPASALPQLPADIDSLTEDELRDLHTQFLETRASLLAERAENPPLARLREIRQAIADMDAGATAVANAVTERIDLNTEFETLADAPALPEAPDPATTPPAASDDDPQEPTGELVTASPAAPPGATTPATAALTAEEIAAQSAGGAPPVRITSRSSAPMVASLGEEKGHEIGNGGTFDFEAMSRMMERFKSGDPGKDVMARIASYEGSDIDVPLLRNGESVETNDRHIREAIEDYKARTPKLYPGYQAPARTAAICDPLDIIREIPNCVQATEPFSDSLPQRPAGRLGFQFTPAMSLATMASGVSNWTEANQAAVVPTDPATWKPCVAVTCPTPTPTRAEAIAACFYFDITTDMSNPERIQDAMNKITAYKARVKTARLLQIAQGLSSWYSFTGPYGALPDFIHAIATILAQAMYAERLDDAPYNLYVPPGLLEDLVIDRANRAYSNQDAESRDVIGYIEGELADAGHTVQVIQLADVPAGSSAPFPSIVPVDGHSYPLPNLGGTSHPFRVHLIAPESALYYATGEMNTGIERSPDLMRRNQAQWFMEEFVGLAKPGCHPWFYMDLTLCSSGARAGLTSPYSCPGAPS